MHSIPKSIAIILIIFAIIGCEEPVVGDPPVANFEYQVATNFPQDGWMFARTDTIYFTDNSTGNPTEWFWDFGDGNTSTEQNPFHVYTEGLGPSSDPEAYDITLIASNEFGNDTAIKENVVIVLDWTVPIADFYAEPVSDTAPCDITFYNTSTTDQIRHFFRMDYGDGSHETVDYFNTLSHIYDEPGIYTISLIVSTSAGNKPADTLIREDYITIY